MPPFIRPGALANLAELADRYNQAQPFPHIVIEDFLDDAFADEVHKEVRRTSTHVDASNDLTQKRKVACTDWDRFEPATLALISYFNSAKFIEPLEQITRLDGLLSDPWLEGGGIHLTSRGGFLKMHTDFNWNAKLRLDRRVNILYYLNKDWRPDWGGELNLALESGGQTASIEPRYNRLVLFNTNDFTLHGHPHPLTFPEDYARASIAMYYYTSGVEVKERRRRRSTTTRYLPLGKGDIDLRRGSLRTRLGYLLRRFTRA